MNNNRKTGDGSRVSGNCLAHFSSRSIIQSTPGGDSFPLRVLMCNIIAMANAYVIERSKTA